MQTAWSWLVGALALHVADEASTGFLAVYNPTVRALRERLGWFPMPEFAFGVWLAGLIALVIGLALLTPFFRPGARGLLVLAAVFAGLMVLNGVAHVLGTIAGRTVSTVRFPGPMPGFWSSPLLIVAALHVILRIRDAQGSRRLPPVTPRA